MANNLPWYKRNPNDWLTGTTGLSLELRGFYSECLDEMWRRQGQLPKDDKWLSLRFQCSTRLVRALMPKLIAAGKMIETAEGYYNPRMMADILGVESVPNQPPFEPQSSATRAPVEREPSAKKPKNPTITTRDLEIEIEIDKDTPQVRARARSSDPFGFRTADIATATFDGKTVTLTATERTYWIAKFGSEPSLDAALRAIVQYLEPNGGKTISVQVSSQLGKQLGWKLERDERSERTAKAKADNPQPATKRLDFGQERAARARALIGSLKGVSQ